jgi:hypothetical protein
LISIFRNFYSSSIPEFHSVEPHHLLPSPRG